MVIILTRNLALVSFIFAAAFSFIILSQSGITGDHIFNPMGLSTKMFTNESSGISLAPLILFIILFPLSYSILCMYSLSAKEPDYTILLAPLLVTPLILFCLGISIPSLLVSIGFIISSFLAYYTSYQDKEHYKKISVFGITKNSTGKSLLVLNIVILLSAYLLLHTGLEAPEDRLKSDMGEAMGNIMPAIIEGSMDNQKQQTYKFIEYMEDDLLNSMESGMSQLTKEERDKCTAALRENMAQIDAQAKSGIDEQFEQELNASMSSALLPESMIKQVSPYYPWLIVFTLFATIELLRIIFFAYLSGTYAWIFSKFIGMPLEQQTIKTEAMRQAVLGQSSTNPSPPAGTLPASHASCPSAHTAGSDPYYLQGNQEPSDQKKAGIY